VGCSPTSCINVAAMVAKLELSEYASLASERGDVYKVQSSKSEIAETRILIIGLVPRARVNDILRTGS